MSKDFKDNKHVWNFSRIGGIDRVNFNSGSDFLNLEFLDQKLWTALSCPVYGLELDHKTLELIDTDKDGRIRAPEVIAAVKWITSVINNPADLLNESKEFPLGAINTQIPEGKQLLESAKQILINIDKPDATILTAEETSDTVRIFGKTQFNGDGIITKESTTNDKLSALIETIVTCTGSVTDRSGNPGITAEHVENFYTACNEYSEWCAQSEQNSSLILPLGDNTAAGLAIFNAIKTKIDDYFIRCKLAEFDSRSTEVLNLQLSKYDAISLGNLPQAMQEIEAFPICKIEAKKSLPLEGGINPAWETQLNQLRENVIIPLLGKNSYLTESEWKEINAKFAAYQNWMNEKKGILVENLGKEKVREILAANQKQELIDIINTDKALEEQVNSIVQVDRLVRYYRDIYTLLKNFVSFSDFYTPGKLAVFQAGTLYIDRRSCYLCIKVNDMARHNLLAHLSGIYLLYAECVSKSRNEKMTVVTAITNGDVDNLMIGRNAVFYDRAGNDWDATIIKIIENPISIRQAFWAPYKRLAKLIDEQIAKMASAREKKIQEKSTAGVADMGTKIETKTEVKAEDSTKQPVPATEPEKKAPVPPFDMAKFAGIFAAIGLAIGAIGTALVSIVSGFFSLVWWKMPLVILGILFLISGPSMILAWLKLRKRNLAPVLDANGWAINARSLINIRFGSTLTDIAKLPKNARREMKDPYTGKKVALWKYLLVVVVILVIAFYVLKHYGILQRWGII